MKTRKSGNDEYHLKVVVAYEDADSQALARNALDQIKARLHLPEEIAYSMWKFDFLKYPAFKPMAAAEAEEADIVVVAGHEHEELDMAVRDWLRNWHKPDSLHTQALAFIGGADEIDEPREEPAAVCAELRHLANEKHVDFFCL